MPANDEAKQDEATPTGYTGGELSKTNKPKLTEATEYLASFPKEFPMNASAQWRAGYVLALERVGLLLNGK